MPQACRGNAWHTRGFLDVGDLCQVVSLDSRFAFGQLQYMTAVIDAYTQSSAICGEPPGFGALGH